MDDFIRSSIFHHFCFQLINLIPFTPHSTHLQSIKMKHVKGLYILLFQSGSFNTSKGHFNRFNLTMIIKVHSVNTSGPMIIKMKHVKGLYILLFQSGSFNTSKGHFNRFNLTMIIKVHSVNTSGPMIGCSLP